VAKAKAAEPLTVDRLTADPANRRVHTQRNLDMITASLRNVGSARSIVIDEANTVLAGNGVLAAAAGAGLTKLQVVDVDGDTIVAVRRSGLTEEQKRALAIYDNRTAELSEWNPEQLAADMTAGLDLRPFWTAEEEAAIASRASAEEVLAMAAVRTPRSAEAEGVANGPAFQTFQCPLSTDQERIVRGALRAARLRYQSATTGEALTAALKDWHAAQSAVPAEAGPHVEDRADVPEAGE